MTTPCQHCCKSDLPVCCTSADHNNGSSEDVERTYRAATGAIAAMRLVQGGRCYVCAESMDGPRNEHVDHDHETGKIRGLACRRCNVNLIPGLDFARTNPSAHARFLAACGP